MAGQPLAALLVALGLLGLVMAATALLLQSGLAAWGWGASRGEAQQSARAALERMARELREAGLDPPGAGFASGLGAEAGPIVFPREPDGHRGGRPTSRRASYAL